jgi:hypothetical protein
MSIFAKSKKRKTDESELAKISAAGEGRYKTTARRATDATGKTLKRKTTVTISKKEKPDGYNETPVPDTVTPGRKWTTTEHKVGDMQGKTIYDRPTTDKLIKDLRENPKKGKLRQQAQAAGKNSYNYKGKEEYAGRDVVTPHEEPEKRTPNPPIKTPRTKTVTTTDYHRPKKAGLTIKKRRISGGVQNKYEIDLVRTKKTKERDEYGDRKTKKKTVMLAKYSTKTKGTKSKRKRE